jgi:DNA primase
MDSVIDEIKDRIAVEDLLAEYIQLKKAGNSYKAICPFHNEKSASLMISPEKGIWHCFGCNEGGDIFGFVMRMEGMEFPEALRLLAKKAGVELRREDPKAQSQKGRLYEMNELAAQFFKQALTGDAGKIAREYIEKRQIDQLTQDQFAVGYSENSWDALLNHLRRAKFSDEEIFRAGLIIKRNTGSGYYDRFRNRLMFPLRDVNGQVIGFTARVLDPKDEGAKYINSPETPIYHKGKFLYALDAAKVEIKKKGYAILVEGQMDAISSHQAGVKNVIATSGTALTEDQLKLLLRYTNNLVLAFDMDNAGQTAAIRGIDLARTQGFNIRVATSLAGKDPDDLIKQDVNLWKQAIKDSISIMDYYFKRATDNVDAGMVENKKKISKALLPQIAKIQDAIEQEHYIQKLSATVGVDEAILRKAMKPKAISVTSIRPTGNIAVQASRVPQKDLTREERLLLLALENPNGIDKLLDSLHENDFEGENAKNLYKSLETFYNSSRDFELPAFEQDLGTIDPTLANTLSLWKLQFDSERAEIADFDISQEFTFTLKKVQEQHLRKSLDAAYRNLRLFEENKEDVKIREATQSIQTLLDKLYKVTKE